MPLIIDGHNLLWSIEKNSECFKTITNIQLCHIVDRYLRLIGEKGHISVRVDQSLLELFERECRKYGGNASRTMDVILWRYFGKPTLSFESEEQR